MSKLHIHNLKKIFEKAEIGQITINGPDKVELCFKGDEKGPICDFIIKDWAAMDMIMKRGDIGLGEAYHLALWESSNIIDFLTYCSLNIDNMKNNGNGVLLNKFLFYLYNQFIRINTKYGSKKNIFKHYDIGNEFYSLWLDPTMTYSSAIRKDSSDSLEHAQLNKYNRIITNLELENKNVLEIGCGWGGFAEQVVKVGAQFTGITISKNQCNFAKQRLANKANIIMQDYRDVNSKYERIVSIEMFEAVGEKYWSTYFKKLKQSLLNGGKALIQTITIQDNAFNQYRKNSDYIRHHIFPGGILPSKSRFISEVNKAQLDIANIFEFGNDYAWTLRQWYKNFDANKQQFINMNYSLSFLRAWEFYLSMSIAGFESQRTNVMQIEIHN